MRKFVVVDSTGNRLSSPMSESEAQAEKGRQMNESKNSGNLTIKEILNG